MKETLTKENFWNEMYSKYPKATQLFCDWIDQYKKAINWKELFNETYDGDCGNGSCGYPEAHNAPKFHELPYAFQQGIWIEFATEKYMDFFGNIYHYGRYLREDIIAVLAEFEKSQK